MDKESETVDSWTVYDGGGISQPVTDLTPTPSPLNSLVLNPLTPLTDPESRKKEAEGRNLPGATYTISDAKAESDVPENHFTRINTQELTSVAVCSRTRDRKSDSPEILKCERDNCDSMADNEAYVRPQADVFTPSFGQTPGLPHVYTREEEAEMQQTSDWKSDLTDYEMDTFDSKAMSEVCTYPQATVLAGAGPGPAVPAAHHVFTVEAVVFVCEGKSVPETVKPFFNYCGKACCSN